MERQRGGISPTPVGEMLLESYQRMETGKISLTVGEGFVSDLVASPLHEFTQRYAGIQLDIHTAGTSGIIEAIVDDHTHIGLMFHPNVES